MFLDDGLIISYLLTGLRNSECTVNGQIGDGTGRGSCEEDSKCYADGLCKANCKISGAVGNGLERGTCDENQLCHPNGSCTTIMIDDLDRELKNIFYADMHLYHV